MSALRTSLLVVGLLSVAGCKKDAPAAAVTPPKPAVTDPAAAPAAGTLAGTIAERIDAPNYTYLRITGAAGDTWAAVPTTSVAVGTRVTIVNPMPMQNFESKTLGRTFELVMFGSAAQVMGAEAVAGLGEVAAPPAGAPPAADPHAAAPRPAAAAVDLANIKVPKATTPDGRSVAEVYAQRIELKDKTASVRGKVVKVTSGVLGHNWLHVRDGSGTDAALDNDLIITTKDEVQVNDVVTVQGTVRIDKDLGSGYSYKVLIEEAKVTP